MYARGTSLIGKSVRDFFRTKGFIRIYDGYFLKTKGFLPKVYEIFGSEMPLACMCSTKTAHPLSYSCFGLTIFMIYTKSHTNIMFMIFCIHL